jgi:hypothetical protein
MINNMPSALAWRLDEELPEQQDESNEKSREQAQPLAIGGVDHGSLPNWGVGQIAIIRNCSLAAKPKERCSWSTCIFDYLHSQLCIDFGLDC